MKKPFFYLLFSGFLLNANLHAFQSSEIEEVTKKYLAENENSYKNYPTQRVTFSISNLDNRLSLAPCQTKPIIQPQNSIYASTRFTLRVICNSPSWLQYVSVQVKLFDYAVISRMAITKQTIINADMVDIKEVEVSNTSKQYFHDIQEVINKIAKNTIGPNQILSNTHLDLPLAIRKNQEVTILAKTGNIAVKMKGIALDDGKLGQRIRIKNTKSQRVIEAIVLDSNTVATSP